MSATASVADDFAADAPLRRRPPGDPAPHYTVLPWGESAAALFRHWDAHGNVPPGCVLVRPVGMQCLGTDAYVVECLDGLGHAPLGPVGTRVKPERHRGWRLGPTIVERVPSRTCVVMIPPSDPE